LTEHGVARPVSFRVGLYEAIRRTAEAQHQAVRSDDLERFYDLLVEREKLLEKTEAVPQQLDPVDQDRAASVVQQIMRIDQETERLLSGKIEDAREELGGMAVGRQALSAYGRAAQGSQ
jgi:hypothetical protein